MIGERARGGGSRPPSAPATAPPAGAGGLRVVGRFAPLAVFLLLAGLLYAGFSLRDPHLLPSALRHKPFPNFDLPLLDGGAASRATLVGKPRLVNVWATWCPTCLTEHGALLRIRAETGLSIVGVNYKDDPALAKRWLARHGDPYDFNIIDAEGDLGVDLGVYGAPETFLLDANAVVRHKHVGALDAEVWRTGFEPVWRALAAP